MSKTARRCRRRGIDAAGREAARADGATGMLMKLVMDAMENLIRENEDHEKTDHKVSEKVNKAADRARELAGELRRKVTPEELARETGLSLRGI